jgi:hypothetical protein
MIAPIYKGFSSSFSVLSYLKFYLFKNSTEPRRAELEKAKEDMRRYFTNPRIYDQQGIPKVEAIAQTVKTLKDIYQPGTLDYEAFSEVIKEMGFK